MSVNGKGRAPGTGSALVLLVFSVLALTIFSLISLSSADMDKAAAHRAAETVSSYYGADLQAEMILAEILHEAGRNGEIPAFAGETAISREIGGFSYSYPISVGRELYVLVAMRDAEFEILEWRVVESGEWLPEAALPVWSGE